MISIIIPCHNEAEAINQIILSCQKEIEAYFPHAEIIVVNDASTDGSAEIIKKNDVVYVENVEKIGYGASLKRGIVMAKNDSIVILDGDNTYPANDIHNMYEKYIKGYDLIIADRSQNFKDKSVTKKISRSFLLTIVKFVTGINVPDVNSGMRIFGKKEVENFLPYLSNGFSFTTSQAIVYLLKKKFVGFYPITYSERLGKSKVHIVRDSLRTLQFISELIVLFNPLKLFLLIAFLPLLTSIIFGVLFIVLHKYPLLIISAISLSTVFIVSSIGFLAVCFKK